MTNSKSIKMEDGKLNVPVEPIIPFIEGDGIGPDIWKAAVNVFDSAVQKAYGGSRKVEWLEILAGEKAFETTGEWLPQKTFRFGNQTSCRNQRSTNYTRWRWNTFLKRSTQTEIRSLRVCKAC
jgi:Isocitrate dehydrogenases